MKMPIYLRLAIWAFINYGPKVSKKITVELTAADGTMYSYVGNHKPALLQPVPSDVEVIDDDYTPWP